MKQFSFTLAAIAAILSASCAKQAPSFINSPETRGAELRVELLPTKASVADTEDESKVNSLQVFVFNGDNIDVYGSSTTSSVTVSATQGDRTIYALVNAPSSLKSIKTRTALLASTSSLSSDNLTDGFVMVGNATQTLSASNTVAINVSRIAARIKIDKVTRAFSAEGLGALPASGVKIIRYYLTDVVDNQNYSLDAAPETYLNSTLNTPSSITTSCNLVYDKLSTAETLAQDASYSTSHSLYAYPNEAVSDGTDSKMTRLVLEMQIDNAYYTYPILIPGIQSNRSYEIKELKITRLGNPSNGDDLIDGEEDDPIESASATFNIAVKDWEQVFITTSGQEDGTVVI